MLKLEIPGRAGVEIENVVFDYNGTLAVDGEMSQSIKEMLMKIKNNFNVYILTADTYGTVKEACKDLDVNIKTFPHENVGICKSEIVKNLGKEKTICVGNGYNDIIMIQESVISMGIIGKEGCCGKLLCHCDIVVNAIEDVFDLLLHPNRIKATLRN
ncbi:HAD family hydrolase [Marinisporobacter balticus]|uniref:P-type E1-E2 ATPase n=1 Tax=Marinisporobacter balticus TaxID=2018667 RepID=A0A4R2KML8_9FIRM|nr:HAD family hydrolase [Marinisporobacter balticus]TCO73797.1 P-type E1-E2 ATPase [Marinisporobacter balticus]